MTEPRSVNAHDITDPQSFILRRENLVSTGETSGVHVIKYLFLDAHWATQLK